MTRSFFADVRTGILALVVFTLLTGLAYPYAITGVAQAVFHRQANGSLIDQNGQTVGSSLVGQNFSDAKYFHPRPSAAGADGYDGSSSGGSNLGPTSRALADRVQADVARIRQEDGLGPDVKIPVDAVTASGSGLDPHISPAYAELQIARVARARGMTEADVRKLVDEYTDSPTFGILGEARVNVLKLNLALDRAGGNSAGNRRADESAS